MPKVNRRHFIQFSSMAGGGLLFPQAWPGQRSEQNSSYVAGEENNFPQYPYPRYNLNTIGFTIANSWLMLIKRGDDLLFKTIDHDVISEKWMPHWANDLFRIRFK